MWPHNVGLKPKWPTGKNYQLIDAYYIGRAVPWRSSSLSKICHWFCANYYCLKSAHILKTCFFQSWECNKAPSYFNATFTSASTLTLSGTSVGSGSPGLDSGAGDLTIEAVLSQEISLAAIVVVYTDLTLGSTESTCFVNRKIIYR